MKGVAVIAQIDIENLEVTRKLTGMRLPVPAGTKQPVQYD
jgi:hypothetical protein